MNELSKNKVLPILLNAEQLMFITKSLNIHESNRSAGLSSYLTRAQTFVKYQTPGKCAMKILNYSVQSFLTVCCVSVFLLSTAAFGQMLPQEGMKVKEKNFSSLTSPERASDLDNWKKFNDPNDYDHPEFGYLPADAPCENCVEVLSKRKIDERYFLNVNDPTEYYQQKSLGDLNMLKNGDWVTVDHTLNRVSSGVFASAMGFEPVQLNAGSQQTSIQTPAGTVSFNNWTLFTAAGGILTMRGQADWTHYTVGEDGMYITNVFPGIDAELIVFRGAVKTNFILRENLFGTYDELVFRDRYTTPSGAASLAFSAISGESGVGAITVRSGMEDLLHMSEGVLFARNGPKDLAQNCAYRIDGNAVDVVVPFGWIDANIGQYELVVDPLVTGTATLAQASITGSRYNAACNFANSCDYTLPVSRPAHSTVTNVAWTFTYSANGSACYLEDGAIRIGAGSCISPSTAGYYWFCNAWGGGTCSGTNQTIFGDVASCMPAPGCTPQDVIFTLKFYRSCYGATGTGCNSGACIGAASPWTMTITGNTIQYSNTASPITLSATTICSGGSINASTTGQYGVPGYTYNWSFSPTGTPSVGTGASASIVFPTAGSITLYSIVTDACGNQVVSSRVVNVTPGPTITVNSPTICAGGSAVLTASGGTTYTWSPATNLSATTGASVTANPAATTVYTVTGTTSGCSGTTTSTVTVNPTPVITVNSPSICGGGSVVLTAGGATTYTWSPGTDLSATTGSSVTANPSVTTVYTVTGTTLGCVGTATSTVTVAPNPVITVNSPTICAGSSAVLTAAGGTTYSWSPGTDLSATTGASVTANPATTTVYTVTGTTSGCNGTATATVTVNPNPVVTVNSPTICAGGSATLTASGATSYTWSPGTDLSATTGASVTANPSATTIYTVTGTTLGCTGTTTSTVTVNPNPVVTVNSPTICAGSSATLTASGATSYTWSPGTDLSATTGATVTATPAATTVYTITGTTLGCTGTATSTVTITANPVITVNSPTICAGGSTVLTAAGGTTYSWSPGTDLSATTGTSVTANPATTTVYTVTGTTSGCNGTATATVTVNPNPVVTVNSPTICAGANTTLTATGATTYTWSPATGLSSTTGASVTANPAVTTVYTVTGTTLGCTGTATSTVTVNPNPVVTVNNATICAGGSAILNAAGGTTYTWSPATGLSATTGATVTATPATTTIYTVTGTTLGCNGTATSTVTVNPNPVVTVNSPTFCAGGSTTITASGAAGYSWSPATDLSATTGATVTANPSATTVYTVTGTTLGCVGTATSTVTVNPVPTVTAANNGPLCPGDQLNLTATGTAGAIYSWIGPGAFNSALQNPTIASVTAASGGLYTVQITLNGCTSTATTTLVMNSGLSSAINPAGPFCTNDGVATLTAANPGGTWSGNGITDANLGTFDPSLAPVGASTISYSLVGSCSGVSTATVIVNAVPVVSFSSDVFTGCSPLAVVFTDNSTPAGQQASWSFGDGATSASTGSASHSFSGDGCYSVSLELTDANGCSTTSTQIDMICVIARPDASFTVSNPQVSVMNPVFQFINQSTNAVSYSWNFGDGSGSGSFGPMHTYEEKAGNYDVVLIATNAAGCVDSTRMTVQVIEELIFYVPNTFTPNGDEHNNLFQPVFTSGFDPFSFNMQIYNRWGETVFETKNASVGWDGSYNGELVPEGVYTWSAQFRALNTDEKIVSSGHVLLLK